MFTLLIIIGLIFFVIFFKNPNLVWVTAHLILKILNCLFSPLGLFILLLVYNFYKIKR